ncbi:MAG: hypothetical protein QOJ18_266, partial [Microbacteriaceae bacterium]|nr:hypothetical protein [Microbacteriaceae bacterium]
MKARKANENGVVPLTDDEAGLGRGAFDQDPES